MEDPRILAAGGRILFCPSLVYNVVGKGRKLRSDCGMRPSVYTLGCCAISNDVPRLQQLGIREDLGGQRHLLQANTEFVAS
ncbi:hypothetical protein MUK42_35026 [Musa troglodytarum]|uniref:Uncharacterized protein n=1 Tax=Musa troglodytarum TaxID=320322 RepID=A0A9E7KV41_9LILI|nr:hypothetical protein MUK42_35026 [Musa troglodytarum]